MEIFLLVVSRDSDTFFNEVPFIKGPKVWKTRARSDNSKLRSITVWLTSSLFPLYSAALLLLNYQQFYLFGQIQTSQTGSQPYSDTSSYGECSRAQ